jgi:hypothetical protein
VTKTHEPAASDPLHASTVAVTETEFVAAGL